MVGVGADELPVGVLLIRADDEEDGMKPLQRPSLPPGAMLQVLKAHCWLDVQEAWKLPQRGWSMELVA